MPFCDDDYVSQGCYFFVAVVADLEPAEIVRLIILIM